MPRFLDTRYEDGRDNPFDHERNGECEESNSASLIRNSTSKNSLKKEKLRFIPARDRGEPLVALNFSDISLKCLSYLVYITYYIVYSVP